MTNADPIALIDQSLRVAIRAAFGEGFDDVDPILREAQKREFGDWQANVAMSLGKRLGKPPREVAETILDQVDFGNKAWKTCLEGGIHGVGRPELADEDQTPCVAWQV